MSKLDMRTGSTAVMVLRLLAEKRPAEEQASTALRLGRLLHAKGELTRAVEILTAFRNVTGSIRLPVLVELGAVLLAKGDKEGCTLLQAAIKIGVGDGADEQTTVSNYERKLRATALAILAARCCEPEQVSDHYTDSLQLDPQDPYVLCEQLAHNLEHTNQPAILDSARPAILSALDTCQAHVGVGIQLPRAWFTMGRLLILLRRDSEALDSYAKAIRFYLADGAPSWRVEDFEAEIAFLQQVAGRTEKDIRPENKWARQLLRMGYWLKTKPDQAIVEYLKRGITCNEFAPGQRVLIVAGGTRPDVQVQMETYRGLLKAALDRFEGVVISGGTTEGIPGLVGEVSAELQDERRKNFTLIGYRPEYVRSLSGHYNHIVKSGQKEALGLGEPLQMWLDLLAAGVDPGSVRLLGINGGRISRFEYALALALGALVGLVESSRRSADSVLCDPDWSKNPRLWPVHPRLLPLPKDPMTAQAFTRVGASDLPPDELERMGEIAHEVYRKVNNMKPDYRKPNTLPWECLPEQYKKSSRDQAAYAFEILRGWGFQIQKVGGKPTPIAMPEEFVEPMAEQEHGRWNFERLECGWRRAPTKDDERKRSPYIVPWVDLPGAMPESQRSREADSQRITSQKTPKREKIADYDRKSVRAFPRILAEGGYELIPPPP